MNDSDEDFEDEDFESCDIPAELIQLHEIIEWDAAVLEAAK